MPRVRLAPLPSLLPGARAVARALVGLAYPVLCAGCGRRLPSEDAVPVCAACRRRLARATPEMIADRLAALPEASAAFGHTTGLWVFDAGGTVQRLQHLLKYRNRPALGIALGRLLGRAVRRDHVGAAYDLVVPVPLSRVRALERGYNQSEQLARGLADALPGTPPVDAALLRRTRPTRSQTALSRTRRWANVADAFAVADPERARGRRVLLVDDVLTTGATLTAAARPLGDAGASVDLAVLAVAAV